MKPRLGGWLCVVLVVAFAPVAVQAQDRWREWNWLWGELLFGRTYHTDLTIKNECQEPETVSILVTGPEGRTIDSITFVSIASMLTITAATCSENKRNCEVVVPPGEMKLDMIITTPSQPDLSTIPEAFTPETLFHQVSGRLLIRAKFNEFTSKCIATIDSYEASGHIHTDLSPPEPPEPFKLRNATCRDYWETERRPPGLDKDCTDEIRILARSYRQTVLEPLVTASPRAWSWLPSAEQIQQMSIDELLQMKARAEGQRANESSNAEATCREYWETGKRPAGLRKDCTADMRLLAKDFRQRVLVPRANASLKAYEWVPSAALIEKMSIPELLALKALADAK